ncbi:MAG TPA: hypothetical protein VNG95_00915 [Gemmatimonadales bacterium]|nr:hypothetical protein [Gemmatimonadales bacterium]
MQSSRALGALLVITAAAAGPAPLRAQTRYRVTRDGEWMHQTANGKRLARLAQGALVDGGDVQGDWAAITVDGWIWTASVGATTRDSFDLAVIKPLGENLRSAPKGALLANLTQGFLLKKVGGVAGWTHVQRRGWVLRAALEAVGQVSSSVSSAVPDTGAARAAGNPAPQDTGARPDSVTADASRTLSAKRTTVYRAPEGPIAGTVTAETPLRVLGRSGDWSRVQIEGWVKTSDVMATPPGVLVGVSAAELRADPQRYTGQVVRWRLQFIAIQTADDMRADIPEGATYILARGPVPERGFVYVIVPDAKKAAVGALAPLTALDVIARVRAGRSRFTGNPVVELLSFEVEQ